MGRNTRVVIDFEAFSPIDLPKRGLPVYARHKKTRVLCLAFKIDDQPVGLWVPGDPAPLDLFRCLTDTTTEVWGHNVAFEREIYTHCLKPQGWPEVHPDKWRCSAALARSCGLPGALADVAKALRMSEQKDMVGHKIMMRLSRPRPKSDQGWTPEERPGDFALLYDYCKQDVITEARVIQALSPLPGFDLDLWRLDQRMNQRGLAVDTRLCEGALDIVDTLAESANEKIHRYTGGTVRTAKQTAALINWMEDQGVFTPSIDKAHVKDLLKKDLPLVVRKVLNVKANANKSSVAKFQAVLDREVDGVIYDSLIYCGATRTGRWSGAGIQPHNFPKGQTKADQQLLDLITTGDGDSLQMLYGGRALDILSQQLRAAIVARPGHVFLSADYSAIEARVLAWLAGEDTALDAFRVSDADPDAPDLYQIMAGWIYGINPRDGITEAQRTLGKVAVLGLGYGMGPKKFAMTAKLAPPLAEKIVKRIYRKKFNRICKFWYDVETTAIRAVDSRIALRLGALVFDATDPRFLKIVLPSGRPLYYWAARVEHEDDKKVLVYDGWNNQSKRVEREHTWGGKLAENITQATARDIMAEAMQRIDGAGLPPVLTVHDEIVSETPDENTDQKLRKFCRLMKRPPEWAPDCPLAVDGAKGYRFKK